MNTTKFSKRIPVELDWLRSLGAGEPFMAARAYDGRIVAQLVELGALVASEDPELYHIGVITDSMIQPR